MSFPSILVGAAMLLVIVPLVANPLLNDRFASIRDLVPFAKDKEISYEQKLLALRDLDFDYQLGMIDHNDYAQLRGQLLLEAAEARKFRKSERLNLDKQIEESVHRYRERKRNSAIKCMYCGADLSLNDKFCAHCGNGLDACQQCGHKIDATDRFCTSCGTRLFETVRS